MRARLLRRIALAGGVLLVWGVAPARAQSSNQIQACVGPSSNARIVPVGSACRNPETSIVWNITGPAGKNGIDGKDGAPGTNGTSVVITGTLSAGDAHCPRGGLSLADHDGHGTTYYLCNGSDLGGPGPAGTWWGIARLCPADLVADAPHVALCQQVCGLCSSIPGTLPPELPFMPSIISDGTLVVSDSGSIPVLRTSGQGSWAADPTDAIQVQDRVRYQGTLVWLQGSPDQVIGPGVARQFVGVARERFVIFWDPANPDAMQGYLQPYFFPIVGAGGTVNVLPSSQGGSFDGNHFPVLNFLGPLPGGCDASKGCLGTYHFTIHRVTANVPN